MPKTVLCRNTFGFLSKAQLVKLRLKAVRAGVWFRALPRIDRVLVDLTIRVVGSVRSVTLAKNILAVVRKLEGLLENRLLRAFRQVGVRLAQKLSLVAQKWGNVNAKEWAKDVNFARYLAVMNLHGKPTLTKCGRALF